MSSNLDSDGTPPRKSDSAASGFRGGWRPATADQREAEAADEAELAGLIERMKGGDRDAFGELYRRTVGVMYGVAMRILRDEGLAENATHQAFLRAWRYAYSYDPAKGRASAWLTILTRRAALDSRPRERTTSVEDLTVPQMDETLIHPRLRAALAEMPANQRQAVLLIYVYGLTHNELARAMRAPLGTVKSWVRRGTLFLKDALS